MVDRVDQETRRRIMRAVRGKDTAPELMVRRLLRDMGRSGYRLHRSDIPGSPDIAWIGRKLAIFIHGCFWHGHDCQHGSRKPRSNREYWRAKLRRNIERDVRQKEALRMLGWRSLIIWECELTDSTMVRERLKRFLSARNG